MLSENSLKFHAPFLVLIQAGKGMFCTISWPWPSSQPVWLNKWCRVCALEITGVWVFVGGFCGGNTWDVCQGHLLNVSLDLLCGNIDCLRLFPLSVRLVEHGETKVRCNLQVWLRYQVTWHCRGVWVSTQWVPELDVSVGSGTAGWIQLWEVWLGCAGLFCRHWASKIWQWLLGQV